MTQKISFLFKITSVFSILYFFSGANLPFWALWFQLGTFIILDWHYKNNSMQPEKISKETTNGNFFAYKKYLKSINLALYIFIFSACLISLFAAPSFSYQEDIKIAGLENIKPFSAESNFMSLEGYVISYCRINYGVEISRGEARKYIKASKKNNAGGSSIEPAALNVSTTSEQVTELAAASAPAVEHSSGVIYVQQENNKTFKPLENNSLTAENEKQAKKVLIFPFKNKTGNKNANSLVNKRLNNYFKSRGMKPLPVKNAELLLRNVSEIKCYPVNQPGVIKAVAVKNKIKLDPAKMSEDEMNALAKKMGADYIITGEIAKFDKFRNVGVYGNVVLKTKVYDAASNSFNYKNSVNTIKKLNLPTGYKFDSVMDNASKNAINELFNNF